MEGVRWTNEDDDEDEILESAEISKAPEEEAEEEQSWFESRESRAEDFLSIMRGEKGEDEEETEPTSLMGKLIGERPAEIDEEGEDTQAAEVQNEVSASETPDDLAENTQEDSVDSLDVQPPIDSQDLEDLSVGEEDPTQDQKEEEPAPEEELEVSTQESEPEAEEPTEEEPEPITYEEEVYDTPEMEEEPYIDEPEEDPTQGQTEEAPEPEFEVSPQEDEPEPEIETSAEDAGDGDDGGEEPPEVEPAETAGPEQQPGNGANITPENVHVTHEHEAAGAGIVGALLGAEFFARRRGDRKLRKQMEQNKKLAEEADETNKEKMLRLEEEQRKQTEEQERLRKAQNDLKPVEARMEDSKDRQETTGEEIQSITGETFFDEENADSEEGRERKVGMKLETNIEESPEELALVNKELSGEQALDSRHESSSLKDDGADPEAMVSGASSPTHISDVISSNQRMRAGEDIDINDALDDASQSEYHPPIHESYMNSVQAGVAIGLIIVVFTAIIFFLR